MSHQRTEVPVYKRDVNEQIVEGIGEQVMKKSCENRFYLKKKLFRFQYQPSTTINDHIILFNKLVADLLNLEENVKDEDNAWLLLASLLDEYDHLVTTLLHGKDEVIFDEMCNALYNTEIKKNTGTLRWRHMQPEIIHKAINPTRRVDPNREANLVKMNVPFFS